MDSNSFPWGIRILTVLKGRIGSPGESRLDSSFISTICESLEWLMVGAGKDVSIVIELGIAIVLMVNDSSKWEVSAVGLIVYFRVLAETNDVAMKQQTAIISSNRMCFSIEHQKQMAI